MFFSENFIRTDAEIGGTNNIHTALSTDLDKIVNLMGHQLYAIFSNYSGEDLVPSFGPGISSDKQRADRWLWPIGLEGSTVAKGNK